MADTDSEEMAFLRALGSEVRAWRLKRRISRAELASAAGISASTLGRIERASGEGTTSVGDAWRIARELQLSLTDLVRRAEDALAVEQESGAPAQVLGEGRFRGIGVTADVPDHVAAQIGKRSISEEQETWE